MGLTSTVAFGDQGDMASLPEQSKPTLQHSHGNDELLLPLQSRHARERWLCSILERWSSGVVANAHATQEYSDLRVNPYSPWGHDPRRMGRPHAPSDNRRSPPL
jgi:hypothetical protein